MRALIGVVIWFLIALFIGASGIFASLKPPFPQLVLFGFVVVLLWLFRMSSTFHSWLMNVDIRALVLVHLTRFVGIYFLILYGRGELPFDFAVPGGLGDIAVAVAALLISIFSPIRGAVGWKILLLWNLFGFVDIMFVVATAARLAISDPESMSAITRLPLSLLPTFLVPIIIFTHIIILIRLVASRKEGYRDL
jgi:hypothetical protein